MQASQESRHDDFDMTKLQKSLAQQQQRSRRQRNSVTKLTPAEIRSLNNSVAASRSSSNTSRKVAANTPPATPDDVVPNPHQITKRNSVSLPTPPQSPDDAHPQRRNSASRNGLHIHSPIPQSHSKAGFVLANGSSRPSSAASVQRGMPTYRGPEVTKTGSFSMLQPSMLAHQIVDNPLSQFSRPRQSRGSVSPTRQEQLLRTSSRQSDSQSYRSHSLTAADPLSGRSVTPPALSDSPVSAEEDEPALVTVAQPIELGGAKLGRAQTIAVDRPVSRESQSRFSWNWRKSMNSSRGEDSLDDHAERSRARATTWSKGSGKDVQSVAYESTASGVAPQKRDSLKGNLPSDRTSIYSETREERPASTTGFSTHPAVRPLSAMSGSTNESKGKSRMEDEDVIKEWHDVLADDSVPMYSRCGCCGKLRKPAGNRSLSPVLENENIRTNFSMEIERTDNLMSGRRRSSSSASRSRYTPIIPMLVADGHTVQAKIAPKTFEMTQQPKPIPVINERGDIIATGSQPIALIPKKLEEMDKTITRFSSLHLKDETQKQINSRMKVATGYVSQGQSGLRNNVQVASDDDHSGPDILPHVAQPQEPGISSIDFQPTSITKDDQTPEGESRKPIIESTTATNGADTSSEEVQQGLGSQPDQDYNLGSMNGDRAPTISSDETSSLEPGTALTTDDIVVQHTPQKISPDRTKSPKTVSFDPQTMEQRRSSIGNGSIYKRSSMERQGNPSPSNGIVPTYTNFSSRGFATKPKSTPQYVTQLRDSTDESTRPASSTSNTSLGRKNTGESTHMAVTSVLADATGARSNPKLEKSRGSGNTPKALQQKSTAFNPLPLPQLGVDFRESTAQWSNYTSLHGRNHSNLVESVLAATNGEYTSKERARNV